MNRPTTWENAYLGELAQAQKARLEGNEGMARVCARRAAGIVIGEYFTRQGLSDIDPSAYERIKLLNISRGVSAEVKEITDHLMQRVDKNHELPIDSDLIAETQQLTKALL